MRIATILSAALLTFAAVPSFAADCNCTKECMTQCQKGEGKDCKCDNCDCKHSGKCSHGQCKHEAHQKKS